MKISAIIVAAGTGKRMGSSIPKQYLLIHNKPVLYYTLKAFEQSRVDEIIIVTGKADCDYVATEIVEKYHLTKITKIVEGGVERTDSVLHGLEAASDADIVLIHDGVRPAVEVGMINRGIEKCLGCSACVAAVPVKDTIKIVSNDGEIIDTPDRKTLYQMQTPQVFKVDILREAYNNREENTTYTDDAALVEACTGEKVQIFEGDYRNIKITTPEDISIAEMFIVPDKYINQKK